jgi:hypothetical protein
MDLETMVKNTALIEGQLQREWESGGAFLAMKYLSRG